ncbi:hypothetical protein JTE90_007199 [Oedothorax gibbosus]|uniref:Uncharacterized protein n=1 Tax=Oedothorax gibbosus TaxID=931172 RepID=A0AAV6UD03_9ARAC|nr:hypothetical protein JTE90_007199 [Oedothorax gibbosus]
MRYLIGSTIKGCECPSGYEGSHCEKRKEDKRLMAQCLALGCSQTCGLTNHGDYKCTCLAGYHLSEDKKTCVEKGRTRYLVSFKLYDQNVDLAHLDTTRYTQLKKGIESALLQLFQPKLYKVENMTVLNFQPGAVVQFHFFGEQEDSATARSILEEALRSRNIGKYAVDRSYVGFEAEPALSIQSVESSVKMPVVGGSELSLACLTRGSSAMRVSWLKDGHPIDPQGTPHIWTTLVPKNSRDQYTAILGFDKAHVLDSGEFTCQVTDWGSVHTRTLRVSVVSFPRPKVVPITATVAVGERLVVTCFSDDEGTTSLGYNWLKNGRILNPSVEPEVVEDLFPGGSRLLIQTARASATYTCIVNSVAGGSRKDATVTVIAAGGNTPICQAEKYLEVQWSNAAVNTEDIQFCPKGYTGEVRRHCTLQNDNGAAWIEPDYSGCLSSEFLAIKDKFESLRLGYLLTDVGAVLVELRTYVWRIGARFHVAEGEPVVDLLEGMHDYLKGNMEHIANNSQSIACDSLLISLQHRMTDSINNISTTNKIHQ